VVGEGSLRNRAVRFTAAGLVCAAALATAPPPSRAASAQLGSDARVELLGGLESTLYPRGTSPLGTVAADGANSVNAAWEHGAGPGLYIEEQRHGEEAILDGLVRQSSRLWRIGLHEFTWGFARQGRDGGFPGTHDAFHSTSFFVEGVAHTMLVVRAGAAAGLPLPRGLVHSLNGLVGRLHAAARWMARPDVWRAGIEGDAPFTHRRFLVAAAVGLAGELTRDRTLKRLAHTALVLGLARQRPDGVFPELGGYDSSYQLRGMAYAEQYLAWVPDAAAGRLNRAIARGLRWELSRIRNSGQVVTTGNTRANGLMVDHNGIKRVVYPMVVRALTWWGLVMRDPRLVVIGRHVVAWSIRHPSQVGR
jgi:hypothetical protein